MVVKQRQFSILINYCESLPLTVICLEGHIAEYFGKYSEAESNIKAIEVGKSKTCYQKLSDLYKNKMKQPERAKLVLQDFERKRG